MRVEDQLAAANATMLRERTEAKATITSLRKAMLTSAAASERAEELQELNDVLARRVTELEKEVDFRRGKGRNDASRAAEAWRAHAYKKQVAALQPLARANELALAELRGELANAERRAADAERRRVAMQRTLREQIERTQSAKTQSAADRRLMAEMRRDLDELLEAADEDMARMRDLRAVIAEREETCEELRERVECAENAAAEAESAAAEAERQRCRRG